MVLLNKHEAWMNIRKTMKQTEHSGYPGGACQLLLACHWRLSKLLVACMQLSRSCRSVGLSVRRSIKPSVGPSVRLLVHMLVHWSISWSLFARSTRLWQSALLVLEGKLLLRQGLSDEALKYFWNFMTYQMRIASRYQYPGVVCSLLLCVSKTWEL